MVLLAGVFGLGLANAPSTIAAPARASTSRPTSFVLYGVDWHRDSESGRAGLPEVAGERATVYGTLVAEAGGRPVGEFQAVSFFGDSPFSASEAASLEQHAFNVAGDTIFGIGSALDSGGVFAVVGGSGRFAGARGSYTAVQSAHETGGDGTARFEFTLV
jgi:hypothetical protein